jgi:hypothetical protein
MTEIISANGTHAEPQSHGCQTPAPLRAIRHFCLECAGTSNEVALCVSTGCPLYLFRFGHRPTPADVASVASVETHPCELPHTQEDIANGSRLKAVRRKCLDCSGNNIARVRHCKQTGCPLHAYRMGKGNRRLTSEQQAAAAERLRQYRASRSARKS